LPINYASGTLDDSYYSRGIRKGDLKLGKEFNDIVPILTLINRWKNLDNKQNFYIKN
jgi:hypothetical protein